MVPTPHRWLAVTCPIRLSTVLVPVMHGKDAANVAWSVSDQMLWPNGVKPARDRRDGTTVVRSPPLRRTAWVLAAALASGPSRVHSARAASLSDLVMAARISRTVSALG